MLASLVAALAFAPLPGWHTGASGMVPSAYGDGGRASSAWIARGVGYRDTATADPPNRTLRQLPRNGVIVWAVAYGGATAKPPVRLALSAAKRFDCCEAAPVAGADYELSGAGPRGAYSVIVRVYFGSRPTKAMRAQAQAALAHLRLP